MPSGARDVAVAVTTIDWVANDTEKIALTDAVAKRGVAATVAVTWHCPAPAYERTPVEVFTRQFVPASDVTAYVITPGESDVAGTGVIVFAGITSAVVGDHVSAGVDSATVNGTDCVPAEYASLWATCVVIVHDPDVTTVTTGKDASAITHPAPESALTEYVMLPDELLDAVANVTGEAPA